MRLLQAISARLFTPAWRLVLGGLVLLVGCGGDDGGGPGPNDPAETAPVIQCFAAEPGYIVSGGGASASLVWQVSDADHLTITPDVGVVSGANGSAVVQPAVTTTYTLSAANDQGSVSATAVVAVGDTEPAGGLAYGDVPTGLPPRLCVGLVAGPHDPWMRDSGAAWDMRYHYFVKGWRDNWGWDSSNSGQWGLDYLNECDAQGFIPVIQSYYMNGEHS